MITLLQVISSSIVLYIHSVLDIDVLGVNLFFVFCSFIMLSLIFLVVWRFKK